MTELKSIAGHKRGKEYPKSMLYSSIMKINEA